MPVPYTVNLMDTHAPKIARVLFSEAHEAAASRMLNELHYWAEALLPLHRK
jgi:hypothetical protein